MQKCVCEYAYLIFANTYICGQNSYSNCKFRTVCLSGFLCLCVLIPFCQIVCLSKCICLWALMSFCVRLSVCLVHSEGVPLCISVRLWLSKSVCLNAFLSDYLSVLISLSVRLSDLLLDCLHIWTFSVNVPVCISVKLSVCLALCLFFLLSDSLSVWILCLCAFLPICQTSVGLALSVWMPFCQTVGPSGLSLSVCFSACLSGCLPACRSAFVVLIFCW